MVSRVQIAVLCQSLLSSPEMSSALGLFPPHRPSFIQPVFRCFPGHATGADTLQMHGGQRPDLAGEQVATNNMGLDLVLVIGLRDEDASNKSAQGLREPKGLAGWKEVLSEAKSIFAISAYCGRPAPV